MNLTIEKGHYEGYVWRSDESTPQVFLGEEYELSLDVAENPFVAEAQLFDRERGVSYSVRFVDGEYRVQRYELKEEDHAEELEYIPAPAILKAADIQSLKYLQYWREEADALCENMNVLQPAELVFVGFKQWED